MGDEVTSEAARALAAKRKKETKTCAACGKSFTGLARALYCSHECALRAYRERNRDELNRRKREKYQQAKGEAPPK